MKAFYPLILFLVLLSTGFSQQDSCSQKSSFAKSYAEHDNSLEIWRMRSLFSGLPLPVVGPLVVGVFAANTKVDTPSVDSTGSLGQCFETPYSQKVKTERIEQVANGGIIGSAFGIALYSLVFLILVSMSFGNIGGIF